MPSGSDNLMENSRFYGAHNYAGSLCFGRGKDDFIASVIIVFLFLMLVVTIFVGMVMLFMIVSLMIVSFVAIFGLTVTGA